MYVFLIFSSVVPCSDVVVIMFSVVMFSILNRLSSLMNMLLFWRFPSSARVLSIVVRLL